MNIFGEIKGENPNLELEDVNFPFKNLYVKVFILNIFGEIKGDDPKLGLGRCEISFQKPLCKGVHFEHFW